MNWLTQVIVLFKLPNKISVSYVFSEKIREMNSEITPPGAFSERYLRTKTNLPHGHPIPIMDVSGTKSLCIGQSTQSQSISYINSVKVLTDRHMFSFPRSQTSDTSTVQWVSLSAATDSPEINVKLTKFNSPEKTVGGSLFRRHRLRRVIPTTIGLMQPSAPEQSNTIINEPRDIRRSTICGTTRPVLKKFGIPQGYKITGISLRQQY